MKAKAVFVFCLLVLIVYRIEWHIEKNKYDIQLQELREFVEQVTAENRAMAYDLERHFNE